METSKNHHIRIFLRNGRLRVNDFRVSNFFNLSFSENYRLILNFGYTTRGREGWKFGRYPVPFGTQKKIFGTQLLKFLRYGKPAGFPVPMGTRVTLMPTPRKLWKLYSFLRIRAFYSIELWARSDRLFCVKISAEEGFRLTMFSWLVQKHGILSEFYKIA